MSLTPKDDSDESVGWYLKGWQSIIRMTEEGRSWSGKEKHCCFLNIPGSAFADISSMSGLGLPDDGRGVSVVDWDHDGDLDLWVSSRNAPQLRFFRNESNSDSCNFIKFRLVGTKSNRDAIGARITLLPDDEPSDKQSLQAIESVQSLRAGEGFLSQNSKWVHFGLG